MDPDLVIRQMTHSEVDELEYAFCAVGVCHDMHLLLPALYEGARGRDVQSGAGFAQQIDHLAILACLCQRNGDGACVSQVCSRAEPLAIREGRFSS